MKIGLNHWTNRNENVSVYWLYNFLDLWFDIFEFGELEAILLDYFLSVLDDFLWFYLDFWWGFFLVRFEHFQNGLPFLSQFDLLLSVGIADDVFNWRGWSKMIELFTCSEHRRWNLRWECWQRRIFDLPWLCIWFRFIF